MIALKSINTYAPDKDIKCISSLLEEVAWDAEPFDETKPNADGLSIASFLRQRLARGLIVYNPASELLLPFNKRHKKLTSKI